MAIRAFITGTSGTTLTADERAFIAAERPWGFILFRRNIDNPAQVTALVREMREAAGAPDAPVLVDQEGGQVQQLTGPGFTTMPSELEQGTWSAGTLRSSATDWGTRRLRTT